MAFIVADRVKETSTTTGTGAFTLAGAATGFVAFSAKCAVGDTAYYCIQAVDAGGTPTGDWEIGLGTYSATNTLTRTTVTASSNGGAAVSFSAGTKQVFLTYAAQQALWPRERLTANRTYYVRTDGADTNTGLANTAGGAFLTVQKAVDVAASLDLGIYDVTIQLSDATRTEQVALKSMTGVGAIIIQGNNATPSNVLMSATSGNCFTGSTILGRYTIKDLKVQTTTSGFGISAIGGGLSITHSGMVFGACASGHMYIDRNASITATSNYTISGAAPVHFQATSGGIMAANSKTITITGTPAFSTAFALATYGALALLIGNTYSGSATGVRYSVSMNAVIDTGGGTLPGGTAGSTATGGQYA